MDPYRIMSVFRLDQSFRFVGLANRKTGLIMAATCGLILKEDGIIAFSI
jgi:hypothetical protein